MPVTVTRVVKFIAAISDPMTSLALTSSTIGTTEKSHTGACLLNEGRTLGGLAVFVSFKVSMKACRQN